MVASAVLSDAITNALPLVVCKASAPGLTPFATDAMSLNGSGKSVIGRGGTPLPAAACAPVLWPYALLAASAAAAWAGEKKQNVTALCVTHNQPLA